MSVDPRGCSAELREALDSPVPSIRTPFTKEGKVDLDGVRSQVDFAIAGKARTLMVTWGDSLFSLQTDEEIAELVKVVVEQANGRAKVIAADNSWATPKAVSYAEYCRDLGAGPANAVTSRLGRVGAAGAARRAFQRSWRTHSDDDSDRLFQNGWGAATGAADGSGAGALRRSAEPGGGQG